MNLNRVRLEPALREPGYDDTRTSISVRCYATVYAARPEFVLRRRRGGACSGYTLYV